MLWALETNWNNQSPNFSHFIFDRGLMFMNSVHPLHIYTCMYVCMYVCMYAWVYVCMVVVEACSYIHRGEHALFAPHPLLPVTLVVSRLSVVSMTVLVLDA